MLRVTITNLVPTDLAPNEDMHLRRGCKRRVERPGREVRLSPAVRLADNLRSALPTEPAARTRFIPKVLQHVLALHEGEARSRHTNMGGERGAMSLPAVGAMAVDHLCQRSNHTVADLSTCT